MHASSRLSEILLADRTSRAEDGIHTVLPPGIAGHRYDGRARVYDLLIASRLYNRVVWGSRPDDYRRFARRAVGAAAEGWHLDAGCGTLLLTADAYLAHPERPIVVLDQSRDMLTRARDRVCARTGGTLPGHIVFLQGDLLDLPFRPGSFQTILCMGMLHLFDDAGRVATDLKRCLGPDGALYLTSLVKNGRLGDRYLDFLCEKGEVARPRSRDALHTSLTASLEHPFAFETRGNMAYAVLPE